MAEDGGAATYPVVFSDGERETNVGTIKIRPSTPFKNFQETLCVRIGVYPNQITTYLIDDNRHRIPITGRSDFALVAGAEKKPNRSFLVMLRRSKRRSKPSQQYFQYGGVLVGREKYRLLRRGQPVVSDARDSWRYWELEMQRENYARMMEMGKAGLGYWDSGRAGGDGFVGVSSAVGGGREAFCEECAAARAEGRTAAPFHCCVLDEVVVGFRSKAGPVALPRKS